MFKQQYTGSVVRESIFLYQKLQSFRKVGIQMGIGKSTIHRWYNRFHRVFASAGRLTKRRQRRSKYNTLVQDLKKCFASEQLEHVTLKGIVSLLPYSPCITTVARYLRKANISRRRFGNLYKVKRHNLEREEEYKSWFRQQTMETIICIDETGFSNVGNACYGYFPRGKIPVTTNVPNRVKASCAVAVSSKGVLCYQTQPKAFKTDSFLSFMKELIGCVPSEARFVVMDNIAFHRNKEVIALLSNANIVPMFIPPYSPVYNPIEEVFAHVKREFRSLLVQNIAFHYYTLAVDRSINHLKTKSYNIEACYTHTLQTMP
jgi:putative transposase